MKNIASDNRSYYYSSSYTQSLHNEEIWKRIPEWTYEVSSLGRVRRLGDYQNWKHHRILSPSYSSGYAILNLRNKSRKWSIGVHALVALVFLGPTPSGMEVDHIDGNRRNNRADNLRFVTPSENINGSVGRGHRGEKRWNATLTNDAVRQIREMKRNGETVKNIAEKLAVSESQCYHVLSGRSWKHVD